MSSTPSLQPESTAVVPSWKQEANERLAAHRTRRSRKSEQQASLPLETESSASRSAQVAARVAARYASARSYSDLLSKEISAPALEAVPAVGVLSAKAPCAKATGKDMVERAPRCDAATKSTPVASTAVKVPGAKVPAPSATAAGNPDNVSRGGAVYSEGAPEPVGTIAGNLIEFPREIIAPRRARPRLAEGPLREEVATDIPQLRIYEEVNPEALAKGREAEQAKPEWSPIRLDARPGEEREVTPQAGHHEDAPRDAASIEDRLMAALVDCALATLAFLIFVAVFVACTAHPPAGRPALAAAGGALAFFFVLYQYLFFTFSACTPGMRYAQISLCTFEDENPTRHRLRLRIGALLLSVCTLGMGFLWAWFDEDNLGWHDRLSRTYQRSYR